jgi:hypothetical protein
MRLSMQRTESLPDARVPRKESLSMSRLTSAPVASGVSNRSLAGQPRARLRILQHQLPLLLSVTEG